MCSVEVLHLVMGQRLGGMQCYLQGLLQNMLSCASCFRCVTAMVMIGFSPGNLSPAHLTAESAEALRPSWLQTVLVPGKTAQASPP